MNNYFNQTSKIFMFCLTITKYTATLLELHHQCLTLTLFPYSISCLQMCFCSWCIIVLVHHIHGEVKMPLGICTSHTKRLKSSRLLWLYNKFPIKAGLLPCAQLYYISMFSSNIMGLLQLIWKCKKTISI